MDKKPTITRTIAPNQPVEEPQVNNEETAQNRDENTPVNKGDKVSQQEQAFRKQDD